jgi:outer membrane protein OmpA-like peptidoglycan-associated protein
MSKRSLVIGMGIGQLYKTVLEKLGHEVVTVDKDTAKGADFDSVDSALVVYGLFDTVHICTPNFTHFEIAARVAPHSKIVFIEKPGVATSDSAKGCYYFYYDSIALRKINPVSGFSMRFNLQFNQGLSTIQGYPEEELSSLLAMLESYPDITVTVEGHTDDVGTESDNYNLSLARCQSVNKLLLEKGVDKNRIRIKAYGELQPLVANDSDKNRALNRRVQIVVN